MFAVNESHKAIVQRLVSAGADVLVKDKVCGVMGCGEYCMCFISTNVVLWCKEFMYTVKVMFSIRDHTIQAPCC